MKQISAFSELSLLRYAARIYHITELTKCVLCSDHFNVELKALNVLLRNKMWDNVVTVLKVLKSEVIVIIFRLDFCVTVCFIGYIATLQCPISPMFKALFTGWNPSFISKQAFGFIAQII